MLSCAEEDSGYIDQPAILEGSLTLFRQSLRVWNTLNAHNTQGEEGTKQNETIGT